MQPYNLYHQHAYGSLRGLNIETRQLKAAHSYNIKPYEQLRKSFRQSRFSTCRYLTNRPNYIQSTVLTNCNSLLNKLE